MEITKEAKASEAKDQGYLSLTGIFPYSQVCLASTGSHAEPDQTKPTQSLAINN